MFERQERNFRDLAIALFDCGIFTFERWGLQLCDLPADEPEESDCNFCPQIAPRVELHVRMPEDQTKIDDCGCDVRVCEYFVEAVADLGDRKEAKEDECCEGSDSGILG